MANTATPSDRCAVCGGPSRPGFTCCYCCMTLVRQLGQPLAPVVAMAEYRIGDGLHRRLRGYKDAPVAEVRRAHARVLGAMADRWLATHHDRLARRFGGGWDVVVTVPSTVRRAGAPVDAVVGRVEGLRRLHRDVLVRGPDRLGHLAASPRGFAPPPGLDPDGLRGCSALVVDDSHVTGARAQSAAAALRAAGAGVVGIVVLGRVVGPARQQTVAGPTPAR